MTSKNLIQNKDSVNRTISEHEINKNLFKILVFCR